MRLENHGQTRGRGWTAGINNGLTGVASLVFWALFVQGCYEMFRLAMRNRYDGPFEAAQGHLRDRRRLSGGNCWFRKS